MTPSSNSPSPPRVHAYAASFGDDLARDIIARSTAEGDTVLDPFVGSGTTALQSLLLNRNAIGIDVDPVASRISQVLTTRIDVLSLADATNLFERQLDIFSKLLIEQPSTYEKLQPGSTFQLGSQSFSVPSEPAIGFWFDSSHMAILAIMRYLISQQPDTNVRHFLEVAMSSMIIRKWPNTLSYAMDIDHSRPHRPRPLEVQPLDKQLALVHRVIHRAKAAVMSIQDSIQGVESEVKIFEGDAVLRLSELEHDFVDFVLTSPPYLNAIDYPRAHKFSQWWISPEKTPVARSEYLGLRKSRSEENINDIPPSVSSILGGFENYSSYRSMLRYASDLTEVIEQTKRVSKPGAEIVFIVADNVVHGKVLPVSRIISEIFSHYKLSNIAIKKREIKKTRRRYPFGINGFPNTMKDEYLVTGRKG